MAWSTLQTSAAVVWALVEKQHGVISRRQLLGLGYSPAAIEHRIAIGRLFPVHRGIYAVGRRELSELGKWMAAALACGDEAALTDQSAAELWGIRPPLGQAIEVSVPYRCNRRPSGLVVHRARRREGDVTRRNSIPVSSLPRTIVALATKLSLPELERAVNEADRLDLMDPAELRVAVDRSNGLAGVSALRDLLDSRTFSATRSELERMFIPITLRAGLPMPLTNVFRNGFEVDFLWPDLRLIVETDGLRYHRTTQQQTRDRVRDQAHLAAGDTPLRFTHGQVRYESAYVERRLREVVARLQRVQIELLPRP